MDDDAAGRVAQLPAAPEEPAIAATGDDEEAAAPC